MRKPSTGRPAEPLAGGYVVEVFSGIQGEGAHVGERHLFLRLAGCGYGCDCCDQPEARRAPRTALIERTAGRRDFIRSANPLSPTATAALLRPLYRATPHRALAVTGGEPLTQADFLARLLPIARQEGMRILLETNGTLPDALDRLTGLVDIVSMDLKLRSATGRPFPRARHERFLRRAVRSGAEVYVKAVAAAATTEREVRSAARLVRGVAANVLFVLQPMTRTGRSGRTPSPGHLLRLMEAASEILDDVRVIPQTHKMIGQR